MSATIRLHNKLAGLALARPPRLDDPAPSEGGPTKENETPAETGIS